MCLIVNVLVWILLIISLSALTFQTTRLMRMLISSLSRYESDVEGVRVPRVSTYLSHRCAIGARYVVERRRTHAAEDHVDGWYLVVDPTNRPPLRD